MATEKRLIDANALTYAIEKTDWYHISPKGYLEKGANSQIHRPLYKADDIYQALKDAPTVDAVEVPCKIGDEVWAIRNYKGIKHPQKGFVSDMIIARDMKLHIVVKHIARGEWGKDVFATYEEAAEAIGERKDSGQA